MIVFYVLIFPSLCSKALRLTPGNIEKSIKYGRNLCEVIKLTLLYLDRAPELCPEEWTREIFDHRTF